MGTQSRVYLKNKWVSGYKPTQADYDEFFDSFYNISDDSIHTIGLSVDGLGSAIQTGSCGFSVPQFSGTIQSWSIIGNTASDIVIDIRKDGVSLVGSGNKPYIIASTSNIETISGWDTSLILENEFIEYVIESTATFSRINLVLKIV